MLCLVYGMNHKGTKDTKSHKEKIKKNAFFVLLRVFVVNTISQ